MSSSNWMIVGDLGLALFCTAVTRALLGVSAGFKQRFVIWDSLSANAYGIYWMRHLFVVWG